jgi:hypothetical protein
MTDFVDLPFEIRCKFIAARFADYDGEIPTPVLVVG